MGRSTLIIPAAPAEQPAANGGDFDAAHQALVADRSLQFEMKGIEPPPPPPGWLQPLMDLLSAMGPVFKVVFWLGLAALVVAVLWFIAREVIRVRLPDRTKPLDLEADGWRPAPAAALALLSDADALAAEAGSPRQSICCCCAASMTSTGACPTPCDPP